jgi:O-antigen/teichoic acid export membrane protein
VTGLIRPAFRSAARLGWGFGDQALSSLTNFALGILVARSVSTEALGAFGLALVTYWTALGVGRAISSQPLVIRYTAVDPAEWRRGTAAATGTMVTVGLVAGLISIVIGRLVGGALGDAFLALGVSLPGLLLQDCWRFAFLADGRGRSAFMNDLVWTVVMIPAIVVVIAEGGGGILWLMLAWGGSATLAALFGIRQSGVVPAPARVGWWLRLQRDLASRYAGEAAINMGSRQVSAFLVATIGGLIVTGTLRAGDILLSPLNVVFQGVHLIGVPEGVRALGHSPRRLIIFALTLSTLMAVFVLAWGVALVLLPAGLGQALLGQAWAPAQTVVVPLVISLALGGVATGATIGLRALAAAERSLWVTTVGSLSGLAGVVIGVSVGGAAGVAWAIVIVSALNVGIWWWQFERALRDHRSTSAAGPDGSDHPIVDSTPSSGGGL